MSIYSISDAIDRARRSVLGLPSDVPNQGIGPVTSTSLPPLQSQPTLTPGLGLQTVTSDTARLEPKVRKSMARQVLQTEEDTPGTLGHVMAGLDKMYQGNVPEYTPEVRDKIKYRIQKVINDLTARDPSFIMTKAQATLYAHDFMSKITPKDVNWGPKGQSVVDQAEAIHDRANIDPNESIFDAVSRLSSEPFGPTADWWDKIAQIGHTIKTPDYTPQLESVLGQPGHVAGKLLKGAMGNFNPGAIVAAPHDIVGMAKSGADAAYAGDSVLDATLGKTPQEKLDSSLELLGGILGGFGMHGVSKGLKGARALPREIPDVPTPTEGIHSVEPPRPGEVTVANKPTVESPIATTPKVEAPIEAPIQPTKVGVVQQKGGALADLISTITHQQDLIDQAGPKVEAKPLAKPTTNEIPGVELGTTKAQHPQGGPFEPMKLKLVELDDLKTSHDQATGTPNPDYLFKDLQTRDRGSAASRQQILENAMRFNNHGEVTTDFLSTDKGPPIVGPDGMVESGNGRIMAAQAAREANNPAWLKYQEEIKQMHPEAQGMKNPVLVRITDAKPIADRVQFARDANGMTSMAHTSVEAAQSAATAIPDHVFDNLHDTGSSIADAVKNRVNDGFIRSFLDNIDPNEARTLANDPKALEGRVKAAVLAKVLGPENSDVLARLVQDGDYGKRIASGLDQAAVPLVKAVRAVESGVASPELGVQKLIGDSLRMADEYRASGNKSGFWSQGRLDNPDPAVVKLGRALVEAKSQAAVDEIFNGISSRVLHAADGGLFEDGPKAASTPMDLLDHVPAPIQGKPPKGSNTINIQSRQAGFIDKKTLMYTGGLLATGTVVALNKDAIIKAMERYYDNNGLSGIARAGIFGMAALGAAWGIRGLSKGLPVTPFGFSAAKALYSPAEVASLAMMSPQKITRIMGETANALLEGRSHAVQVRGQFEQAVGAAGVNAFGKKWWQSNDFKSMDLKVRDMMETNIKEGRDWSDGLPEKWKAFVSEVKVATDKIIDDWEALGGRVSVVNDGTQGAKIKVGASVRIRGGVFGEYLGEEIPNVQRVANDPFETVPGKGTDFNANARRQNARAENAVATPDAETPYLKVKILDAEGNPSIYKIAPGESFGRPINRLGESFVPRILSDGFTRSLKAIDELPVGQRNALLEMVRKNNPDWVGISNDEMIAKLGDLASSVDLASHQDISSFMANLERERQMTMAKYEWTDADGNLHVEDPYESSYIKSMQLYGERASKRLSIAAQFGPEPSAIGHVVNSVNQMNPQYGRFINEIIGDAYGWGPERFQKTWQSTAASVEGKVQAITKLSTPLTLRAQLNDAIYAMHKAGLPRALSAAWELVTNEAGVKERANLMAAVHEQWAKEIKQDLPPTLTGKLKKGAAQLATSGERVMGLTTLTDAVMTATGISSMDAAMKRFAAITGYKDAVDALETATQAIKENKPVPAEVLSKIDFYGLKDFVGEASKDGAETLFHENDLASAVLAKNIRGKLTYSGDAVDLPHWMNTPAGTVALRFKKPMFVATRFLMREVIGEAAKGNLVPAARAMGYAVAVGGLSTYLGEFIKGKGFDDETRHMFASGDYIGALHRIFGTPGKETSFATVKTFVQESMTDGPRSRNVMDIFTALAHDLTSSGSLGLAGELNPGANPRLADPYGNPVPNYMELAKPVSVSDVENWARKILQAKKVGDQFENDLPNAKPGYVAGYKDLVNSAAWFEAARTSFPAMKIVTTIAGLEPTLTRLHDLDREFKAISDKNGQNVKAAIKEFGKEKLAERARLETEIKAKYLDIQKEFKMNKTEMNLRSVMSGK